MYKGLTEVSEKAANVQRKKKAWRSITQNHFKRLQESLTLKAKYKDMKGG